MKKVLLSLALLVASNFASASTLNDLAGSYKVTVTEAPVLIILVIKNDGAVKYTQQTIDGKLECQGKAVITDNMFESTLKCQNGLTFTQKIDLKNVKIAKKFTAMVYSSAIGDELEMNFEKL